MIILRCGGDRDPKKRPIMGNIATNLSDYVILTNDNPRTEDEKNIMNDSLNHIINLPYLYYTNHTTGDILTRINDLQTIKNLFCSFII